MAPTREEIAAESQETAAKIEELETRRRDIENFFNEYRPGYLWSYIYKTIERRLQSLIDIENFLARPGAPTGNVDRISLAGWSGADRYMVAVRDINIIIEELEGFGIDTLKRLFTILMRPLPLEKVRVTLIQFSRVRGMRTLERWHLPTLCHYTWCFLFLHLSAPVLTSALMHTFERRMRDLPHNGALILASGVREGVPPGWSAFAFPWTPIARAPQTKALEAPSCGAIMIEDLKFKLPDATLFGLGSEQPTIIDQEITVVHEAIHVSHMNKGYFVAQARGGRSSRIRRAKLLDAAPGITPSPGRVAKINRMTEPETFRRLIQYYGPSQEEDFLTIELGHITENGFREEMGRRRRTGYVCIHPTLGHADDFVMTI